MGQTPREALRTILRVIISLIGAIFAFVRSGMVEKVLKSRMSEVRPLMSPPKHLRPAHDRHIQIGGSQTCRGKGGPVFAEGPMSRNSLCTGRRISMARSDWRLSARGWRGIGEMIGMATTHAGFCSRF
jgi:hypothetical protein